MNADQFTTRFEALTGHRPFPWQERLYTRFVSDSDDNIPPVACLPTGLGKTNTIAVWLAALMSHPRNMPKRLVYVVNRRTVVDQTTREVERLRKNLAKLTEEPWFGRDVAISTLRGHFADNHEWSANPSRPAVICGTVDMIGSRLLFSGYRIGFKARPLHAGFLGQDVLLIHDEAHLEPAFQQLIESIVAEQQQESKTTDTMPWPKLRVMQLSATVRGNHSDPSPFMIDKVDREHPKIQKRIKAPKQLGLHPCEDEKGELVDQIVGRALKHKDTDCSVLIFSRKVEDVEKIAAGLKWQLGKATEHIETLTGTMRGYERDQLVRSNRIFARFMRPADREDGVIPVEGTAYLVCTSAGEVGVNLSADHLVCDLTPFESMAQRLGRVNRFGDCHGTRVDVVHPAKFGEKGTDAAYEARREKTLKLLRELKGDASPMALTQLNPQACGEAYSPEPTILSATDIIFDAWAMTTIREPMPGRPPVAPYLHGVANWEPTRTSIAWRQEVEIITGDLLNRYLPADLLEDYPIKPHELLTDRSDRVFKQLEVLAKRHDKEIPVWVVGDRGEIEVTELGKLLEGENQRIVNRIADSTIVLPPSAGGLSETGLLDGKCLAASDVADAWYDDEQQSVPRRTRAWEGSEVPLGMTLIRIINVDPEKESADVSEFVETADADDDDNSQTPKRRLWSWYVRPRDAEDATAASDRPIKWDHHTRDVVTRTKQIMDALNWSEEWDGLKQAVVLAAELHDLGKQRALWQRSIGNPNPSDWHAKPGKPASGPRWRPRRISGYRHEFGSLLDVLRPDQSHLQRLEALTPDMRDVVLHLIAAHHGYARPHFPPQATADPNYPQTLSDETATEVMRRYARLQRRFGRWGLAYLESLLRAADWAASADPSSNGGEG